MIFALKKCHNIPIAYTNNTDSLMYKIKVRKKILGKSPLN